MNERIVDASLVPSVMNEREECMRHIKFMQNEMGHIIDKTILLLDRGYQSAELFLKLQNSGIKFIVRCTSRSSQEILSAPMGKSEVTLSNGVRLVVIKFFLPDGTVQILVSNLFEFSLKPKFYIVIIIYISNSIFYT